MVERFIVDGYEKKPPGMNRAALDDTPIFISRQQGWIALSIRGDADEADKSPLLALMKRAFAGP
jgi:hypothetical protein